MRALPDHATLARGLSDTFPELGDVQVIATLGIGFNSISAETDTGLVFRVARTEGTAARFAMETRLLPILRERLPVAVPQPEWFAERSDAFPLGVIGYRKIQDRPLRPSDLHEANRQELADQGAGMLAALHAIPLADVEGVGLPTPDEMPAKYRELASETLPVLEEQMERDEFERIGRWWDAFLGDERMTQFEPSLTHGDFWFENMLVDRDATQLTGVVDWEHAAIGDRAQDLATQNLGSRFTEEGLRRYRAHGGRFDEDDHHRMRRLWELRHFYGVLYSIRFDDEDEMRDSIRKIREGPILTASEPP